MMSDVDPPDVVVFGWGTTSHGQLGMGGVEDEQFVVPTPIIFWDSNRKPVKNIACGAEHTLFEADGLWSCGNNDYGQLGHDQSRRKPAEIGMFKHLTFSQLGCGSSHSVALTDTGQLFTWGSNQLGQLGHLGPGEVKLTYTYMPKIVKTLSPHVVVQVACGNNHCLALTNYGKLYAWGDNSHGQLGLGNSHVPFYSTPQEITCLLGLTVHQIAAGGYHSFILTVSGSLFAWGKNSFGQLGIGDDNKAGKYYPTLVKGLKSQGVRYVSCGQEHTAVLTKDGGVFTFGFGMYGQLGHNSRNHELLPRKVFELMGSVVTQISCGRYHTLACVGDSGRVYSFGLGASGQLGVGASDLRASPSMVKGPFVPMSGMPSSMPVNMDNRVPYVIQRIFSGGDQCFVLGLLPKSYESGARAADMRQDFPKNQQVLTLDMEHVRHYSSITAQTQPSSELLEDLDQVFSSLPSHNGSFLVKSTDHCRCYSHQSGVDQEQAMDYYARLYRLPNRHIMQKIMQSIETNLIPSLEPSPPGIEALRIYLTLPCCPAFEQAKNFRALICPFARAVSQLTKVPSKIVGIWWSHLNNDLFIRLITIYRSTLLYILCLPPATSQAEGLMRRRNVISCLKVLELLYQVNEDRERSVPVERFYINELQDKIDIKMAYIDWIRSMDTSRVNEHIFSMCKFPFVLNAQAKSLILQTDAILQMQFAVEEVNRRNLTRLFVPTIDPINPCLILYVNRNNLVQETITQIQKAMGNDLKKPLKVMFIGEEALDAGGVKKEFFLLIIKEIMDPKYGMFRSYEESRLLWFQQQTFEEDNVMFMLIGVLCGLAIYNGTIIDLKFPLALYKKLLNKPVIMDDLKHLDPCIYRSLQQLLEYEGSDIEDMFGLNFEITREVFGELINVPLVPNAKEIPVSKENRQEYVDAYIDYVFNVSSQSQFKSFNDGFHKVVGGKVLQLFHAQELQAMVMGNENYDWEEFQKNTEYKVPYYPENNTIKMFWEAFRELDEGQKKQFLLFLTGSDRIPIHGMKAVKMTIQPTGGGDEYLPAAHTCFNLLDLPKYNSKDALRTKLLVAIEHSQGFGLV